MNRRWIPLLSGLLLLPLLGCGASGGSACGREEGLSEGMRAALRDVPGDELFETMMEYAESAVSARLPGGGYAGLSALTAAERAAFIAGELHWEVENGGLCQFFVNWGDAMAPLTAEALAKVGAAEHRAIYEQFVKDNGIDLSDMSSFSFRTAEDFIAQYKRYPYDDFDNAYYALPPLDEIVAGYLRGLLA